MVQAACQMEASLGANDYLYPVMPRRVPLSAYLITLCPVVRRPNFGKARSRMKMRPGGMVLIPTHPAYASLTLDDPREILGHLSEFLLARPQLTFAYQCVQNILSKSAYTALLFVVFMKLFGGYESTHMPWRLYGGQRTTCRSWFSPFTVWVLGIKPGSSGLVASTFTC